MVNRIKAVIAHYGMKAGQFADAVGVQRSALSHVLSGRNKPSLDFILRIKQRFPQVSLDWLTLGKGNMLESEEIKPGLPSDSLFSPNHAEADTMEKTEGAPIDQKGTLFDVSEEIKDTAGQENMAESEPPAPYSVSDGGRVERIVIFYRNGTFRSYHPK
jgi:transcriptional regulator with XRE-family HTH domain